MDKSKSYAIQYVVILILGAAVAGILFNMLYPSGLDFDVTYSPDYTVTDNPLMGFAPDASNLELCEKANMVYIPLTWAEWEPEEGKFDIEGLEKNFHIKKWKDKHKHGIIRFICDIPGKEAHMDIPGWLYEKTKKGTFYDTEIGMGYSPDYGDTVFRKYHDIALKALAEYCDRDFFISFVQLGSIGHWGEWHASDNRDESLMPDASVCSEYAEVYSDSFENPRLMTRRNYDFSVEGEMGVFNDMVGDRDDTEEWLTWLKTGGTQETSGRPLSLKAVSDIGLKSPVGGEFTSDIPMDKMLGEDFGNVLQDITDSQMTFIGPMVPDLTDKKYALKEDSILRRMGYRIYPSKLAARYDFVRDEINLELSFRNAGNAGFFFDWPVTVYVFDKDKKRVFRQGLDIDIRKLRSDEDTRVEATFPYIDEIKDEFYIGAAIADYSGEEILKLSVDTGEEVEYAGNVRLLYHYKRNKN
ncbi:DUF4832 domain-containing protein [Oribacterium sp. P6A1]|uniref:DUF4832 domain-containing protein n=1 Tax=Oribacterium sp. P6A1 TaxID=1410612 RepID=UPI00056CC88C|nr:DUF4832 domain-containing protein [Oribacterium sp. P6A1]